MALAEEMRTFVTVDMNAMVRNVETVKAHLPAGIKVAVVVKADAYGHGAAHVGKYLEKVADYYAVATIEEAIDQRKLGVTVPILVLGYTLRAQYGLLARYNVEQTIYTLESAMALSASAQAAGKTIRVHIAVDTGMGRLGFLPTEENADLVRKISKLPSLEIVGLFTHFSAAD